MIDFFGETNPESFFQDQDGIKKEIKRKSISQEAIVTIGESGLVSQTKIGYGDFFKRPLILNL